MSSANPRRMAIVLAVLTGLLLLPFLLADSLYITSYEGDTLHTIEIVLRVLDGERQHIDFPTPLGFLGFAPIILFMQSGMPFGAAFIAGQALVTLLALPAIWWAAVSRFPRVWGYWFAIGTLMLLTSPTYGDELASVTVALHYNRWGWALAFIPLALAILPARGRDVPMADGLAIGAAIASIALIKATYFVAFAPIVGLALLMHGRWRVIGVAVGVGVAAIALTTLVNGADFWLAYYNDLMWVARSEVRSFPGAPLPEIVVGGQFIAATLAGLGGALFVRQSGRFVAGYGILLLVPASIYVTYQNFGNDYVWVILLAPLLFALRPEAEKLNAIGLNLRDMVGFMGAAAVVLSIPLLSNMVLTNLKHTASPRTADLLDFGKNSALSDLSVAETRAYKINATIDLAEAGNPYAGVRDLLDADQRERMISEPVTFEGTLFPQCNLGAGLPASMALVGRDLEPLDAPIFVSDIVAQHWFYTDVPRLAGGTPWNYGSLAGLENAEYVAVPFCPRSPKYRNTILSMLEAEGLDLTETLRTPLVVAYRINR